MLFFNLFQNYLFNKCLIEPFNKLTLIKKKKKNWAQAPLSLTKKEKQIKRGRLHAYAGKGRKPTVREKQYNTIHSRDRDFLPLFFLSLSLCLFDLIISIS